MYVQAGFVDLNSYVAHEFEFKNAEGNHSKHCITSWGGSGDTVSNGQEEIHFKYTLDCCLEDGRDSVGEVYIISCVGCFYW